MIGSFEQYHGAALRELVVSAGSVTVEPKDKWGRVNSFLFDGRIAVHFKHSAKRLAPWQFTFNDENVDELEWLNAQCEQLWLALVCGQDGVVALSMEDFRSINREDCDGTCFVRVDRDRRTQYRVNGTSAVLSYRPARGVGPIVSQLTNGRAK